MTLRPLTLEALPVQRLGNFLGRDDCHCAVRLDGQPRQRGQHSLPTPSSKHSAGWLRQLRCPLTNAVGRLVHLIPRRRKWGRQCLQSLQSDLLSAERRQGR